MIHPKKKVCACARVPECRVHVCSNLGFSVWYYVPHTYVSRISSAPKIRICRYVCTRATSPYVQQRRCPQLLSSLAVSAAVRTWCGGETSTRKTSTSISNAMLLKKEKMKSSTEKQITAIIVHEAKRIACLLYTSPSPRD